LILFLSNIEFIKYIRILYSWIFNTMSQQNIDKSVDTSRFEFGKNWRDFHSRLNDERIVEAERSLKSMLGCDNLEGKYFLDIGSGSGLFSLAARRLGAVVSSFDYDEHSVNCALELKRRYFKDDDKWRIQRGSVLDVEYIKTLGQYDVVYSWGVLHHTGKMKDALYNATIPLKNNGLLFISIYNKQYVLSKLWLYIKKLYNVLPRPGQLLMSASYFSALASATFFLDAIRARNPFDRYSGKNYRGMSLYNDVVDWIGGLPFETASPEEILQFYKKLDFTPVSITTCGWRHGCNEFVFRNNMRDTQ